MTPVRIDLPTARRALIRAQGLDGSFRLPSAKEGAAQAIERLGYVQIDTISVVARAHHHVIWSRCRDYQPTMLDELLARDRRIFEYWTHAAAYVPMCDYRFYLPRMRERAVKAKTLLTEHAKLVRLITDRLKREGPLPAGAFEAPPGKRGPWWDWTPAKRVLETLLHAGRVMVAERRGFERHYDLTEKVLPSSVDTTLPSSAEAARFIVEQVLRTQAMATLADLKWGHQRKGVEPALREMLSSGQAIELEIEGIPERHYALPQLVDAVAPTGQRRRRPTVQILSPFDTFLRRDRIERLFGFQYRIECYTPAAKRQYGYFCLPILMDNALVGRVDAKAVRSEKRLVIRHLVIEPSIRVEQLHRVTTALQEFARFNGCTNVGVERTTPADLKVPLARTLDAASF